MSDYAINLKNIGKMYKLYSRPADKILDVLGVNRWLFWKKNYYNEFWALRDINLKINKGERVGIIGRNGAGKSTLLKIISGNIAPTEGNYKIIGKIQALLELGTGFHPEFTGRENIRASMAFQSLSKKQISVKEEEIIDFAELDEFIDQPIKTYSSGMQARLAFATSTAIEPELLIIDEVLGAGDAYFAGKCVERMKKITEDSGATVLFVSHDLSSVQRLCKQTIWLDRGRIVAKGNCLEVIKAYTKFIQNIENTRLQAKNRKRFSKKYSYEQLDVYSEALVITLQLQSDVKSRCDISEISLLRDDKIEETLKLGDAQDTNFFHPSVLLVQGSHWSEPQRCKEGYFRSLSMTSRSEKFKEVIGQAVFYAYDLVEEANYKIRIRLRCVKSPQLSVMIAKNGQLIQKNVFLQTEKSDWADWIIQLKEITHQKQNSLYNNTSTEKHPDIDRVKSISENGREITKWSGEGTLLIEKVMILGHDGNEQAVFKAGFPLTLSIRFSAKKSGTYEILPNAVLYRIDGITVSNNTGKMTTVQIEEGDEHEFRLEFGNLNLGDGDYVFSVALYRNLSIFENSVFYDLIDRSYQFKVVDNLPFNNGIFKHHGEWKFQ